MHVSSAKAWNNSALIRDNIVEEINKLKQQEGQDILVYGSATLDGDRSYSSG
ncbi:MAG TPA: hypothetical protein V6D18_15410 [Thermosynechococcaceae cyanobacterium]